MFKINKRVIFADTDAGGIVYHSKYLDFCEELRMEFLLSNNLAQNYLLEHYNIIFVATGCEIKYKKPAKVEDMLEIRLSNVVMDKLTIKFYQDIYRNDELLVQCRIDIVAITKDFKIVKKLPEEIAKVFSK